MKKLFDFEAIAGGKCQDSKAQHLNCSAWAVVLGDACKQVMALRSLKAQVFTYYLEGGGGVRRRVSL